VKHVALLILALFSSLVCLSCNDGQDLGPATATSDNLDFDGGYGPDVQPAQDAAQESATAEDAEVDAQQVPDAGTPDVYNPVSPECEAHGKDGKITVYVMAPVTSDQVISIAGWLDFPNWLGAGKDTAWGGWCWASASSNELSCIPPDADGNEADAYEGTYVEFAPGTSPAKNEPQSAWYCDKGSCPIGTFVVCSGKREVGRIQSDELKGSAELVDWDNDGYPNPRFKL